MMPVHSAKIRTKLTQILIFSPRHGGEPERSVKLPHLHNLGLARVPSAVRYDGRKSRGCICGEAHDFYCASEEQKRMKKFLVTYLAPASVIAEWKKTDPAQRREAETKMQAQWKKWMADNAKMFIDVGAGVGKTKLVNTRGTSDTKNDIMLYSVVQAESHEAAAKSFEGHPHLQIPQSSIEIMEIHSLQGMA
jgi:hypothetical protein